MSTDSIEVRGIRAFGYHGVLPHEGELGQEFIADVLLRCDMSAAAATDDLNLTADYGTVARLVSELIVNERFQLIETLADRLAQALLDQPSVTEVRVTVHKPHAPMPVGVADVAVTRVRRAPARAFLGLGGNIGDTVGQMQTAVTALDEIPGVSVVGVSPLYRTAAEGGVEQPDFINAVAEVRTSLTPHELLAVCQQLEAASGRVRDQRWGPRTLDIDILAMQGQTVTEPDLHVPHPRSTVRAFVVAPWADLAPDFQVVTPGPTMAQRAAQFSESGVERINNEALQVGP